MEETIPANSEQKDDFLNIKNLIILCISQWKWFVLSAALALGLAMFYILRTQPEYTRSASILIKEDAQGRSIASDMQNMVDMGLFASNVNVKNELVAISSPAVMYEVVKRLHLDISYTQPGTFHREVVYGRDLPVTVTLSGLSENQSASLSVEIAPNGEVTLSSFTSRGEYLGKTVKGKLGSTLKTPIGNVSIQPTAAYKAGERYSLEVTRTGMIAATSAYSAKVNVSMNGKDNTIIDLSIKDKSIQRAEDVLNMVIAVYNENWVRDKNQIAVATSMFIDERLAVIESELGNVDEDISTYKSANLLPDVQAASNLYMTQNSQTNAQITALNNQLYMTRYVRGYLTNSTNSNKLLPANSGIDNGNIERHISEYNALLLQRNNLVANSSTKNPLVADMDQNLEEMRQAIVVSIDNQLAALNNQIASLQKNAQQTTARIAANPNQAKYLLSVERQQKVKEALYLFLLQKREENELSQAFQAYNTRIITPPYGSLAPTSPVRAQILIIALAAGLVLPFLVFFLMETLNSKIRGRKDLDGLTVPFAGEIPLIGEKPRRLPLMRKRQQKARAVVVREGSRDIVNEAFRVLRTNLEFMCGTGGGSEVIVVTSFLPGSGKSFLTLNIAVSLAIKKNRVLVIDGDLRHASTSAYAGSPRVGLSDYLNGRETDLEKLIVRDENFKSLHILPVGTLPPNPTELLFSEKMKQTVETVRGQYDYVFLDCPPVEMVADTQILERLADRCLFVLRADVDDRGMLAELESYYREKKYRNMSVILNGTVNNSSSRYGYRYGYKYGYRYGYRYGYGYYQNGEVDEKAGKSSENKTAKTE